MESLQLATSIAKVLDTKKAANVKVLKVRDLTVLTDYFVIANGTSTTHVKSLAEEVEFQLEQQGVKALRTEGYDAKNWILLDYGTVIVHVFYPCLLYTSSAIFSGLFFFFGRRRGWARWAAGWACR